LANACGRSGAELCGQKRLIRIAITAAGFDAVAATLPLGSIMYEADVIATGKGLIWVERAAVERLRAMRGPREDLSDTILRLVEIEAGQT
jgi:hypothetical protein